MELVLVRHAEPERVAPGQAPGGVADPRLTLLGADQAARLAAWLATEPVDRVVTSPLARAVETAAPVAAAHGLEPEVVPGLREFDAAADHYLPVEELRAARDDRWFAMIEGRWEDYGGENPATFRARIVADLDALAAANRGRRVVAVCHGGVVNVYLAEVLDLARPLWFEPAYASISRVRVGGPGLRTVVSVNETGHLRDRPDRGRSAVPG